MVNLFADMGVQPQTLQSGLIKGTPSTDHTPPVSRINPIGNVNDRQPRHHFRNGV